jgi:protein-S-isoprenylcysteine O-methyltransferase Ste14
MLLKRLGIVRTMMKKDLVFFFVPWLTVFYLELSLCEKSGDGLTGFWGSIWELISQPKNLFILPRHRVIGSILFIVGLTIMIVGQVTLWRNYSGFLFIKKDHRLITHGIYRLVRHPMYLGALIVFIGLPVYTASLYGGLTMILLIPIFLNRIRMEEQLLMEEFRGDYQEYKKNTKKLIPFSY